MPYLKIAMLLSLLLLPCGCVATDGQSKEKAALKVRLLWTGIQCGTNRWNPHATWIEGPEQFEKTFARLAIDSTGVQQNLLSQVDFSREGILLVMMGQKPTGGYGLQLRQKYAVIKNDAAILQISWIEPSKSAVLPQIITSPCLAIILAKGSYSEIRLLDQDAHLRLQLPIK